MCLQLIIAIIKRQLIIAFMAEGGARGKETLGVARLNDSDVLLALIAFPFLFPWKMLLVHLRRISHDQFQCATLLYQSRLLS